MSIFSTTKKLVSEEKRYTTLILKNLCEIEKKKLYCDLGYPSLYKYLVKELKYSEGESNIRINAVRLMLKSSVVEERLASGKLSLTNAAIANQTLQKNKTLNPEEVIDIVSDKSSRKAIDDLNSTFELKTERVERVKLDEKILTKMDKLKEKYGVESTYELIDILLEEKLKAPKAAQRKTNAPAKNSRYIPIKVKAQVYTGSCNNCGTRRNLEYDHIKNYSQGGDNSANNIQILCRACNQRKAIRQMGAVKTLRAG